jgi:hypothetical protein
MHGYEKYFLAVENSYKQLYFFYFLFFIFIVSLRFFFQIKRANHPPQVMNELKIIVATRNSMIF